MEVKEMSRLDEAWSTINGYFSWLTGSHKFDEVNLEEEHKWMFALDKVKEEMAYFLENAPLGDSRRAMILRLKAIMDKTVK
jgi:hypothetical protein